MKEKYITPTIEEIVIEKEDQVITGSNLLLGWFEETFGDAWETDSGEEWGF